MTDKGKKYLSDILMAIELIEDFTPEIIDFNHYEAVDGNANQCSMSKIA